MSIQFELKDKEELLMFRGGLEASIRDAKEYLSACTANCRDDVETLKYWDARKKLLERLKNQADRILQSQIK